MNSTPKAERDARERSIAAIILPQLNNDELRVLETIGLRMLRIGRETHGPLVLERERRDWKAEAAAELADRLFYDACYEIATNDARLERLRCEAADEIAARVGPGLRELAESAPLTLDRRALNAFDVSDEQSKAPGDHLFDGDDR